MQSNVETGTKLNLEQAKLCVDAFAASTNVGCAISDESGNLLYGSGFHCAACDICKLLRPAFSVETCRTSNLYGMRQAERFGGKYIYFCPMGLTCFTSPVINEDESVALVTAGPLLMVDVEDYIDYDLRERFSASDALIEKARIALANVPYIDPERVSKLSTMLFMSVGFLNNVAVCNRMLKTQSSDQMQGEIGDFIYQLGREQPVDQSQYPFDKERKLVQSIIEVDKPAAQRLLNELLGYIFFSSGMNFQIIKSRVYELLVLMSRAAIDGGSDPVYTLRLNHTYLSQIQSFRSIEEMSHWLSGVMNEFTDTVFCFPDMKHMDVIHRVVQYVRQNYMLKISLEDIAEHVYLSPSYFSKLFKKEMGCSFNTYLNKVRIEKSKQLLLTDNMKLIDIAGMLGFEDQSYFSKVFKKTTGVSPCKFKESKGRIKPNNERREQ